MFAQDSGGSLMPMANQIRRAAWIYKNAKSFGSKLEPSYEFGH